MRGLKIKNGKVENIALFDTIPNGWVEAPEGAAIGDSDNGDGSFSKPPKPEPTEKEKKEKKNATARGRFKATDWQVMQYREQIDLGITTSLTHAEFITLLEERQAFRDEIEE